MHSNNTQNTNQMLSLAQLQRGMHAAEATSVPPEHTPCGRQALPV